MAYPAYMDNIVRAIAHTGALTKNRHRESVSDRYMIVNKLGQGTYGKVQLAIERDIGRRVAIKTIRKTKLEEIDSLIRKRREMQIMSSVRHPYIIQMYEIFENRHKLVLVMEFARGGELYHYLNAKKVLEEDEARRLFRQITAAIFYCHTHKICHRDIKLENILLDENNNAKIADFGLSNVFGGRQKLDTFCGSRTYAAPEILKEIPYRGPEVDCWSLGVLLYALVYGYLPFRRDENLAKNIAAGTYKEPPERSTASPLIREMLTVIPRNRATIRRICSHWWMNIGYSRSCLGYAEQLVNDFPVQIQVLPTFARAAGEDPDEMGADGEDIGSHVSTNPGIDLDSDSIRPESEPAGAASPLYGIASDDNNNDCKNSFKTAKKMIGNVVRAGRKYMGLGGNLGNMSFKSRSVSVLPTTKDAWKCELKSIRSFRTDENPTYNRPAAMTASNLELRTYDEEPSESELDIPVAVETVTYTPQPRTAEIVLDPTTLIQRRTEEAERELD